MIIYHVQYSIASHTLQLWPYWVIAILIIGINVIFIVHFYIITTFMLPRGQWSGYNRANTQELNNSSAILQSTKPLMWFCYSAHCNWHNNVPVFSWRLYICLWVYEEDSSLTSSPASPHLHYNSLFGDERGWAPSPAAMHQSMNVNCLRLIEIVSSWRPVLAISRNKQTGNI